MKAHFFESVYRLYPDQGSVLFPSLRVSSSSMIDKTDERKIREKFVLLWPHLNERLKRLWAATEANAIGYGGISAVSRITKLSIATIKKGIGELADPMGNEKDSVGRIRKPGGGRKTIAENQPAVINALENLIEPESRGDPMNSLRWTTKSVRNLAETLQNQGFSLSHQTVQEMLHHMGYSLQSNKKVIEGSDHPDRDEQFRFINSKTKEAHAKGQPVISVDTKKKELIGNFKNAGREWREAGNPRPVKDHDFEDPALGKAVPYGVFDIKGNRGIVNVGTDHDTAEFAVNSIRTWWNLDGKKYYPKASEILITADCGGSNSYRSRLWKRELQKFASESGLTVRVCHFPPGTSKWNTIEHSIFSFISMNWRGQPLESIETVINLIANTKTKQGLSIKALADEGKYEKGIKVSDEELNQVNLTKESFRGEWNYAIVPNPNSGGTKQSKA